MMDEWHASGGGISPWPLLGAYRSDTEFEAMLRLVNAGAPAPGYAPSKTGGCVTPSRVNSLERSISALILQKLGLKLLAISVTACGPVNAGKVTPHRCCKWRSSAAERWIFGGCSLAVRTTISTAQKRLKNAAAGWKVLFVWQRTGSKHGSGATGSIYEEPIALISIWSISAAQTFLHFRRARPNASPMRNAVSAFISRMCAISAPGEKSEVRQRMVST